MAKVLVIGQGGREHALAWRLHREGHEVHVAPGSDGIARHAACHPISVSDADALVGLASDLRVALVVVGPEQPLVDGLADRLLAAGIPTVGPRAAAAELEGSKAAAKSFMQRHGVPTARSVTVGSLDEGLAALAGFDAPPVVKADGLAAGKGVTVCQDRAEAEAALRACFVERRFGSAGAQVVLEERLVGEEASLFVLTDGRDALLLEAAQDHKRIGEGDTGPNTGGMGAYVPAPVVTDAVRARAMREIVEPTLLGLRDEGRPLVGFLFVGLMVVGEGAEARPMVIEYNVRLGDPEAQPLLVGLRGELYPALLAAAVGGLGGGALAGDPASSVVLASAGYPASARAGDEITGLPLAEAVEGVEVFHAGTRRSPTGAWETAGGRVLGVCGRGASVQEALRRAYAAIEHVSFAGMQYRRDIGHRIRA